MNILGVQAYNSNPRVNFQGAGLIVEADLEKAAQEAAKAAKEADKAYERICRCFLHDSSYTEQKMNYLHVENQTPDFEALG